MQTQEYKTIMFYFLGVKYENLIYEYSTNYIAVSNNCFKSNMPTDRLRMKLLKTSFLTIILRAYGRLTADESTVHN